MTPVPYSMTDRQHGITIRQDKTTTVIRNRRLLVIPNLIRNLYVKSSPPSAVTENGVVFGNSPAEKSNTAIPTFHLSKQSFVCQVLSGKLELLEHEKTAGLQKKSSFC